MSCTAYGVPTPSISWYKDELPIDLFSSTIYNNNTETYVSSSRLLLMSLNFSDVANYSCTATNYLVSTQSSNSSTAQLIVHSKIA